MIAAFIFLGNPGLRYRNTRHNFGMLVGKIIVSKLNLNLQNKFHGSYAVSGSGQAHRYWLYPDTFMNNSGNSVQPFMSFFKLEAKQVCIVHDDLETPFGSIVIKSGGGLAGHNGLRSIKNCSGSQDFWRMKLGISRPVGIPVNSYVLQPFSADEKSFLQDICNVAVEELLSVSMSGEAREKKIKVFDF